MNQIPTREEAHQICEDSKPFYCKRVTHMGAEIEIFNYTYARPEDFKTAKHRELRGLTFVKNGDTWDRFLSMPKFFNVNECAGWMDADLKDDPVIYVGDKYDGSLITATLIGNEVVLKSKASFVSKQAILANKLLDEDLSLKRDVYELLKVGATPMFELCGSQNKVVVDYSYQAKLIYIMTRCIGENALPVSPRSEADLVLTEDNREGWIAHHESGKIVKHKTSWYFEKHKLLNIASRENWIIKSIVEKTIDDVKSIATNTEDRERIEKCEEYAAAYVEKYEFEYVHLLEEFFCYAKEDFGKFCKENSTHPAFHLVMRWKNSDWPVACDFDIEPLIFDQMLKENKTLEVAKQNVWGQE